MNAKEQLQTKKSYAFIGVSQDETKYSYEVFNMMRKHGYNIFPVNPKYSEIVGFTCYQSINALPEKPEVIMLIMSPQNSEKMLDNLAINKDSIFWFPPNCFSEQVIEKAKLLGLAFVYDECPVGILKGL